MTTTNTTTTVKMASPMATAAVNIQPEFCCMHVYSAERDKITAFKYKSWQKYLQCSARWAKLLGTSESQIAQNSAKLLDIDLDADINVRPNVKLPTSAGYHRACYQRFCNIGKVKEAEKRKPEETEGNCMFINSSSHMLSVVI